jgi:hypothetical protein
MLPKSASENSEKYMTYPLRAVALLCSLLLSGPAAAEPAVTALKQDFVFPEAIEGMPYGCRISRGSKSIPSSRMMA